MGLAGYPMARWLLDQDGQIKKTEARLLTNHPPTFFGAAAACLCTHLAVVYIMSFTFFSASIADVGTQHTILFCESTIHRHDCGCCPTDCSALSVYLSAACHHFYILFPKVTGSTILTGFGAPHAGIYAALPFRVLEGCGATTCHNSHHTGHHI
jgi:hypothetical protein